MVIFSYTGSPQVKISEKVLGEATFLTHTVYQLLAELLQFYFTEMFDRKEVF